MRFNEHSINLIATDFDIPKRIFSFGILELDSGKSLFQIYISNDLFVLYFFWIEFCLWIKDSK